MEMWKKPKCEKCPHVHFSEKGARCYAIYPYIGIRQEFLDKHHRNCPVTNYFENKDGKKVKPSVTRLYGGVEQ